MQKKGAQKYQNKTAFKVTFNDHYREMADQAPKDRLCELCLSQIEWKLKYGKYKVASDLSKCHVCTRKVIRKAYRKLCDRCSDELNQCAKCFETLPADQQVEDSSDDETMEETMKGMRERSKRTIQRRLKKEEIVWDKQSKCFVEVEGGAQVVVYFKKDYQDEDNEDLWESESDEEKSIYNHYLEILGQKKKKQQAIKVEDNQITNEQLSQESEDYSDLSDVESDEYINEVYSDGSIDLDKFNRKEKNFRYYFGDNLEQDYDN